MTPFQQQVFDALADALDGAPSEAGEVMVLAPRVAAAIEVTLMADRRARASDGVCLFTSTWHKIALMELRGEQP